MPWVQIGIAAVSVALSLFKGRKGPQQRVATTQMVDELEPILAQNVVAYFDSDRSAPSRAAALANFDDAWSWLASSEACGSPAMGKPGRACIADRARGGKHDWFALYRDPIATDATPALGKDDDWTGLTTQAEPDLGLALVAGVVLMAVLL